MDYKAVIFDMDGVLIDSEPLHVKAETQLFIEKGIPLTKDMATRFAGTTTLSMWRKLAKEFNLKEDPVELANEGNRRFIQELKNTEVSILFDGVAEVLSVLKKDGFLIALASSSSREIVDTVLERFGLSGFFNVTVSGSEVVESKPHPEIFLLAAKKLNVQPKHCVVVEDSTNGARAAKLAGMKCIGFKSKGNHHELNEVSVIINSYNDFNLGIL